MIIAAVLFGTGTVCAESKRVEIYNLPQTSWNVRPGDTLSGIAAALLPNAPGKQQSLMQSILEINPDAFINHNPDLLRAYIRLVLPGDIQTFAVPEEDATTHVEEYSWGSVIRRTP